MYQDNLLNYYSVILIGMLVIKDILNIYTNKLMSSLKNQNIKFQGSWLKNPLLSDPNFTSKRLYKNIALVSGVQITAILFLHLTLRNYDLSGLLVDALKYAFGFVMFFALDAIITALNTLFQAKHYDRPEYIQGTVELSLKYLFKLKTFTNFWYAVILWSFAVLTMNSYLTGGAVFFSLMAIRGFIGYKRFSKKAIK